MRTTKHLMFLAALLSMVVVAHAQDVHYNYDRGANFQSYRTYQWVDRTSGSPNLPAPPRNLPPLPPNFPAQPQNLPGGAPDPQAGAPDDQLIGQDIKRAVDEQLAQKGLTRVEKNADLQVTYHAAVREEKSINLMGERWMGMGSIQGETSTIPTGTLMIDVYDSARKQLIWRGDVSKTLDIKKDPNKNYKNLQKAMAKLFKNYPPPANK